MVVDFVAFTPDHVRADIDMFAGRTGQYVFISSASAYQKPPPRLPVAGVDAAAQPVSGSTRRDKIACEDLLVAAYRDDGFPVTIVRPSHTYDRTSLPLDGGWTVDRPDAPGPAGRRARRRHLAVDADPPQRLRQGLRAAAGQPAGDRRGFHITSDEVLSWDQIYRLIAAAAGARGRSIVHVPSDAIAAVDPEWGAGLLGDKTHSVIFDNTKIRAVVPDYVCTVPFDAGAREIVAWHDADPARQWSTPCGTP